MFYNDELNYITNVVFGLIMMAVPFYLMVIKARETFLGQDLPLVSDKDPLWAAKTFNTICSEDFDFDNLVNSREFLGRLAEISRAFGAKEIACVLDVDEIKVVLTTKRDVFEVGNLFSSTLKIETYKRFYDEICSLLSLVLFIKNEGFNLKP